MFAKEPDVGALRVTFALPLMLKGVAFALWTQNVTPEPWTVVVPLMLRPVAKELMIYVPGLNVTEPPVILTGPQKTNIPSGSGENVVVPLLMLVMPALHRLGTLGGFQDASGSATAAIPVTGVVLKQALPQFT